MRAVVFKGSTQLLASDALRWLLARLEGHLKGLLPEATPCGVLLLAAPLLLLLLLHADKRSAGAPRALPTDRVISQQVANGGNLDDLKREEGWCMMVEEGWGGTWMT